MWLADAAQHGEEAHIEATPDVCCRRAYYSVDDFWPKGGVTASVPQEYYAVPLHVLPLLWESTQTACRLQNVAIWACSCRTYLTGLTLAQANPFTGRPSSVLRQTPQPTEPRISLPSFRKPPSETCPSQLHHAGSHGRSGPLDSVSSPL
jgi:hypothetical protein